MMGMCAEHNEGPERWGWETGRSNKDYFNCCEDFNATLYLPSPEKSRLLIKVVWGVSCGGGVLKTCWVLCLGGDAETEQHVQTKAAENEQTVVIWFAEMIITSIAAESHSPHSL